MCHLFTACQRAWLEEIANLQSRLSAWECSRYSAVIHSEFVHVTTEKLLVDVGHSHFYFWLGKAGEFHRNGSLENVS